MNVIEEVDVDQAEEEDHIWLTTKLVYDWVFVRLKMLYLKKKQANCQHRE